MEASDFNLGDYVRYIPHHANGDETHTDCESGQVRSTNDRFVFVEFPQSPGRGLACDPETLKKQ